MNRVNQLIKLMRLVKKFNETKTTGSMLELFDYFDSINNGMVTSMFDNIDVYDEINKDDNFST